MQSRYYNPEIGRFINADALVATGQGILGMNMFVYCRNNSSNLSDLSGLRPVSILERFDIPAPPKKTVNAFTVSIGGAVTLTIGPHVFGGQVALVTDTYGVSEIQITEYSTLSATAIKDVPSVSKMIAQMSSYEKLGDIIDYSLTANMSFYDAPSVENLYNDGYQIGGAVGTNVAVAVDYNVVPNGSNNPYKGITISAGMGSTDGHAVMGHTWRLRSSRVSVYDVLGIASRAVWEVR